MLSKSKNNFTFIFIYIISLLRCETINAACDPREFECDNGICISSFSHCDGIKNCPDGSDETADTCIQQREYCDKPFFRCTYGACVIGTAGCNGVKDCADGSDETLQRCGDEYEIAALEKRLQNNCKNDEMKCPSGICLPNHKKCDGHNDCGDGYDETIDLCAHIECPGYTFTCGYGACIDTRLKCNGDKDCFDGSDEATSLCNYTRTTTSAANGAGGGAVQVTPPPVTLTASSDGCPIPEGPERPLMNDRYGFPRSLPIRNGEVFFKCEPGRTLVGEGVSFCANKQWSADVPKCLKFCHPIEITGGYSTEPTCQFAGQIVPCKRKHPPGTVVTYLCATYFKNSTTLPTLTCLNDGHWSGRRQKCESECGEIAKPTKEFSTGGFTTSNRIVPWHVGLYAFFDEQKFQFICGGTILTPDLIITAAHCIWDKARNKAYSADIFQIAAAKLHRDYYKKGDTDVFRNISEIKVHAQYKGVATNYVNDIAFLLLERTLEFSNVVRPICLYFYERAQKELITNEIDGRFAGWDFQGEHELQFVEAQSKSNERCLREYNADLANDKFCLFSKLGGKACRGDSGGGFTYQRQNANWPQDRQRFNLLGIISNAPGADHCAADLVVLTNIQHFVDFIENERRQSFDRKG